MTKKQMLSLRQIDKRVAEYAQSKLALKADFKTVIIETVQELHDISVEYIRLGLELD